MANITINSRCSQVLMGGVTMYGAETEGMTIHRLPHLGIHPIYNHQTKTLCGYQQKLADRNLI